MIPSWLVSIPPHSRYSAVQQSEQPTNHLKQPFTEIPYRSLLHNRIAEQWLLQYTQLRTEERICTLQNPHQSAAHVTVACENASSRRTQNYEEPTPFLMLDGYCLGTYRGTVDTTKQQNPF